MEPAQASEKNDWVQDAAARCGIYDVGGEFENFSMKNFAEESN